MSRPLSGTALEEAPGEAEALIEEQKLEGRLSAEKPEIDWSSEEERREWLGEIVCDAQGLLSALDGHQLAESEAVREAAGLLGKILAQDITDPGEEEGSEGGSDEGGSDEGESVSEEPAGLKETDSGETDSDKNGDETGPRIREGVATDRVISTVDPEMRHGRKSSSTRFDGYKVHITEAVESEFITGVAVGPGNQQDVEVVAKLPTGVGGTGDQFDKTDFEIDLETGQVTCPAGRTAETAYQTRDPDGASVWIVPFSAFSSTGRSARSAHCGRSVSRQKTAARLRSTTTRTLSRRCGPTTRLRSLRSATASDRRSSGSFRSCYRLTGCALGDTSARRRPRRKRCSPPRWRI